jgi:nucleotide-binding universal stress UspA family protein
MFRSLLIPVDGSAFGEHALPWALSIARRTGASLKIAHVAQPPSAAYSEAALYIMDELRQETLARDRAYLEGVVRRVKDAVSVPVEAVELEGDVAPALCEQIAQNQIDLVVLATHGRGPLGRFWLGSVADEMVRRAPAPLLLIRPDEGRVDLARECSFHHVLIPLDGSEMAERILEPAVALGSLTKADYTFLRVIKPFILPAPVPEAGTVGQQVQVLQEKIQEVEERMNQEASDYLEGVANRFRSKDLRVQTQVALSDRPASAVLHAAEHTEFHSPDELAARPTSNVGQEPQTVDLIALETHGRRGLSRLVLGSVADKVIRGAHIPVLVHRPLQA